MKLFFKKLFIILLIIPCITIIPGYVIDPYNVFHWDNIRVNGVVPNKNFIKMKWVLNNPQRYNAFLFGSSRVGVIHVEKMAGRRAYNMSYTQGIPTEHLQNVKTLIKNNVRPNIIYIGVDNLLMNFNEENHREFSRCSYEYLEENPLYFYRLYTNPYMLAQYFFKRTDTTPSPVYTQMYKTGWDTDYGWKSNYNWANDKDVLRQKIPDKSIKTERYMHKALQDLKELKDICKDNNIEMIVFTNPMYKTEYMKAVNDSYLLFLRELADITPFYNFSGLNSVTTDTDNYLDPSHYTAEIGDMVIEVIENGKKYDALYDQGFGWHVTNDNIDELLKLIDVP